MVIQSNIYKLGGLGLGCLGGHGLANYRDHYNHLIQEHAGLS